MEAAAADGEDSAPCALCAAQRALLHCAQHAARLCLPCDLLAHAPAATAQAHSQHHRRAPLCDACHAAPAAAYCDGHRAVFCAPCARAAGCDAQRHPRRPARAYTGIPDVAELARILFCDDYYVPTSPPSAIHPDEPSSSSSLPPPPPALPEPSSAAADTWVPDLVNVELAAAADLPASSSTSRWAAIDADNTDNAMREMLLPGNLIQTGGNDFFQGAQVGGAAGGLTGDGDDDLLLLQQQDWPGYIHSGAALLDDDLDCIAHGSSSNDLATSSNLIADSRDEGALFQHSSSTKMVYNDPHPLLASCPVQYSTDPVVESLAANNAAYQLISPSLATANTGSGNAAAAAIDPGPGLLLPDNFYAATGSGMPMLPREEFPTGYLGLEVTPPGPESPAGIYLQDQAAVPPEQASSQDMEARKRQEKREAAKQRYKDKKKSRRFGKQIMYVSRKVRADTRNRVKGRFAKAPSGSGHGGGDDDQQSTQHGDDDQPAD